MRWCASMTSIASANSIAAPSAHLVGAAPRRSAATYSSCCFRKRYAPTLAEAMRRYQATGQLMQVERRIQINLCRANGPEIPTEIVITRLDTATGPLFTLHIRDLRVEREAANALRRSEKKHRVVLDTLREVIFQTDRAGVLTYLNLAWRRTSHYLVEDSIGRSLTEFVSADDRYALTRLFESLPAVVSDAVTIAPIEARFTTAEGAVRLLHVSVQPLVDCRWMCNRHSRNAR